MAEHEAAALKPLKPLLQVVGATFLGIKGDKNHPGGYHRGYPPAGDYSLGGWINRIADPGAACAIDIGMDWDDPRQAREWVEWGFDQFRTGKWPHAAEFIGSEDGRRALYASWNNRTPRPYIGSGHIHHAHLGVGRVYARFEGFAQETFGRFLATPEEDEHPEDSMPNSCVLADGTEVFAVIGTDERIWITLTGGMTAVDWKPVGTGKWLPGVSMVSRDGRRLDFLVRRKDQAIRLVTLADPERPETGITDQDMRGFGDGPPSMEVIPGGLRLLTKGTLGDGSVYRRRWSTKDQTWSRWERTAGRAK